LILTTKGKRRS